MEIMIPVTLKNDIARLYYRVEFKIINNENGIINNPLIRL